jgi:hypothetical protein
MATDSRDMVTSQLPKGCVLLLMPQEYDAGIRRGLAMRRRQAFEKRMARLQEQREQKQRAHDAQAMPCD